MDTVIGFGSPQAGDRPRHAGSRPIGVAAWADPADEPAMRTTSGERTREHVSMLRATFQRLIKGIGAKRERYLWEHGVSSWDHLALSNTVARLPALGDSRTTRRRVARLQNALESHDIALFARLLCKREHYRIALEFPDDTVFLDIETTGLSRYYDDVTAVGWWYRGHD